MATTEVRRQRHSCRYAPSQLLNVRPFHQKFPPTAQSAVGSGPNKQCWPRPDNLRGNGVRGVSETVGVVRRGGPMVVTVLRRVLLVLGFVVGLSALAVAVANLAHADQRSPDTQPAAPHDSPASRQHTRGALGKVTGALRTTFSTPSESTTDAATVATGTETQPGVANHLSDADVPTPHGSGEPQRQHAVESRAPEGDGTITSVVSAVTRPVGDIVATASDVVAPTTQAVADAVAPVTPRVLTPVTHLVSPVVAPITSPVLAPPAPIAGATGTGGAVAAMGGSALGARPQGPHVPQVGGEASPVGRLPRIPSGSGAGGTTATSATANLPQYGTNSAGVPATSWISAEDRSSDSELPGIPSRPAGFPGGAGHASGIVSSGNGTTAATGVLDASGRLASGMPIELGPVHGDFGLPLWLFYPRHSHPG